MRRIGGFLLAGAALVLLAACNSSSDEEQPAAATPPPGLHPFLYHENPIIDGPSLYWLTAMPTSERAAQALWCDSTDPADEILRIDNEAVEYMTREEIAAYFSGAHGWPVRLRIRPEGGGTREVDCYGHP